jgi:glutamate dehydrogenase/leucine dehydrogenase
MGADENFSSASTAGSLTGEMLARGHEQVVFVADRGAGLRAVIAIHSTALGPSLGGVRFWKYASEPDAVADVLRLSQAMTYKAAVAGLHQGGGKAVVLLDHADAPHTDAMLHALGRAIDELGGRYLAAEDVGATPADMEALARVTPWATGVGEASGGSGDPSPVTAFGVVQAMRAAVQRLDGVPELAGRSVAIQGAGHVGAHLARMLVDVGARVTVADVRPERAAAVARSVPGAEVAASDEVLELECDVVAPCALGLVLTRDRVARLRCRVVCGAANNQLASDDVEDLMGERGIVFVPDFVANAGGIINIAEEFTGYSRERAMAATASIFDTVVRVFEVADARGVTPGRAAVLLARGRIEREGAGRRWQPGDPAAWTNGEPLRRLRAQSARP